MPRQVRRGSVLSGVSFVDWLLTGCVVMAFLVRSWRYQDGQAAVCLWWVALTGWPAGSPLVGCCGALRHRLPCRHVGALRLPRSPPDVLPAIWCAPSGGGLPARTMMRFQVPSPHAYRYAPAKDLAGSRIGALRWSPACMRIGALYRRASHVRTLCASGCCPHVRTLMRFRKPSRQMTPFSPGRMPRRKDAGNWNVRQFRQIQLLSEMCVHQTQIPPPDGVQADNNANCKIIICP